MKGSSLVVAGVATLVFSTSAFSCPIIHDIFSVPVDFVTGSALTQNNNGFPETRGTSAYMVTDKYNNTVTYLDGVDHGTRVSSSGNKMVDSSSVHGDKITNLKTGHTGVITGIKHQGTMDVMTPNGVQRYQYVTFKVSK